jgi:N-dimethylarginine dimethylaminohydrolase
VGIAQARNPRRGREYAHDRAGADQAFIGATREGSCFVVMSRMRHPSRQREVPYYRDWFRTHGYEELEIDLGAEYLEGHGDLLWHPGRRIVWAGYGH